MEFLGIGPLELLFILLIALIVIGPKDMLKTGRNLGKMLRKVITSPQWQTVTKTSREIRNIPNRLIREAGLEEMQQELDGLRKTTSDIQKTLMESTILPASFTGINQTINQIAKPQILIPNEDRLVDEPVIISSPKGDITSVPLTNNIDDSIIDLSAWINTPDDDDNQDENPDGISAWITPPRSRRK